MVSSSTGRWAAEWLPSKKRWVVMNTRTGYQFAWLRHQEHAEVLLAHLEDELEKFLADRLEVKHD